MAYQYKTLDENRQSPAAYEGLEVFEPQGHRPINSATLDGLQVVPHEYITDKSQGPLPVVENGGKRYIPTDHLNIERDILDDKLTATSFKPHPRRRRALSRWIIVFAIVVVIIIAAVVPAVVVTQNRKSNDSRQVIVQSLLLNRKLIPN